MEIVTIDNSIFDSHCYICIISNKAIVIDPNFEPELIVEYLENNNLELLGILITHPHNDHIFGITYLLNKYNVEVYASTQTNDILKNHELNLSYIGQSKDSKTIINVECIILKDQKKIKVDNFEITPIFLPGHSPGCMVFEIDNNLFTGDFVLKRQVGRVDFQGSNPELMIESINKFKEYYKEKELTIYPGHGEITTTTHEFKTNPFLRRPKSVYFLIKKKIL